MNRQLFDELAKGRPNIGYIHTLLRSGADINALQPTRGDSYLTAFWHMRRGLNDYNYHWEIKHPFWGTVDTDAKVAAFKAHFYPLLDILETYNFDVMNGASFRVRPDGTKYGHMFAGFRLLDLSEFQILAKYDMPRFVQFFERLYFSRGLHVDDDSVIGIPYLSPLLWTTPCSNKPAVVLHFIMKGARWNNPVWRQPGYESRIAAFGTNVPADTTADAIVEIQTLLGVNFITGPQGANLRGFLAAAYGTVGAVSILQKALGIAAKQRRSPILLHALKIHT